MDRAVYPRGKWLRVKMEGLHSTIKGVSRTSWWILRDWFWVGKWVWGVTTGEKAWGVSTCSHSWWLGQSSCHKGSSALSSSSCCLWGPWLEVGGMSDCLKVEAVFSVYFTGKQSHCAFPAWAQRAFSYHSLKLLNGYYLIHSEKGLLYFKNSIHIIISLFDDTLASNQVRCASKKPNVISPAGRRQKPISDAALQKGLRETIRNIRAVLIEDILAQ